MDSREGGYVNKPIVVAEVGLNANGDLGIAKTMIQMAHGFGADYVKFQHRNLDKCYTQEKLDSTKITKYGKTVREEKQAMEFDRAAFDEIDDFCQSMGIKWFASPRSGDEVEFLTKYKPRFIKIAGGSQNNTDLLRAVHDSGIPVVMSTGMATEEELDTAFWLFQNNNHQIRYLLHCVSIYPTPHHQMNMNAIKTLQARYGDWCAIGFSNHSKEIIFTVQAAVMGAEMLEFHITLDRAMDGPDHYASFGPTGFERVMNHLSNIYEGWGSGDLGASQEEQAKGEGYLWRIP